MVILLIVQATSKLSVLKWNTTDRSFRILYRSWQLNENSLRGHLLAFPLTCPKVQAKCTVVKVASSISKKEAACSPSEHVISPERTFPCYLKETPTHHGSTWSGSRALHCAIRKTPALNTSEGSAAPQHQGSSWGSAGCASARGEQRFSGQTQEKNQHWLNTRTGSYIWFRGNTWSCVGDNCTFPLSHVVV